MYKNYSEKSVRFCVNYRASKQSYAIPKITQVRINLAKFLALIISRSQLLTPVNAKIQDINRELQEIVWWKDFKKRLS